MKRLIMFRTLFLALSLFLLSLTSIVAAAPHEHGIDAANSVEQGAIVCPKCNSTDLWTFYYDKITNQVLFMQCACGYVYVL